MKHWLAVIVLSSAVAASAQTLPLPALPDLAPAPQETLACGPLQQTALFTVGGSTCLQATNDLHGVLTNDANCLCGFCSQQFVNQACRVIQGGYQVSGYLKYRCQLCPVEDSTAGDPLQ
jgi:hypothetical protein